MTDLFNNIYQGKKVLITGHNGFKGAWLTIWLNKLGANVIGFSLKDYYNNFIYKKANLNKRIFADEEGDINNYKKLKEVFDKYQPEIIFHLAAQPIVRLAYDAPLETLNTNIIGTANVLECIKNSSSVKCGVIITTDKCYKNKDKVEGYDENDELGGSDPYSVSKACAELITDSYRSSFFKDKLIATARAGNVIGGGDYSKDRLVSDCVRSLKEKVPIKIRNPEHVRPWQHVLEPLNGYLMIGQKLLEKKEGFDEAWNFGPVNDKVYSVRDVADLMIKFWGEGKWIDLSNPNEIKKETKFLNLKSNKANNKLKWNQILEIDDNIKLTVEWYKLVDEEDAYELCSNQINLYSKKLIEPKKK